MKKDLKRRHRDTSLARTHTVSTRLNATELDRLDLMRGEYRRGEYLRTVFMNTEPVVIPALNREAWVALARSASNLNQLVHHLNLHGLEIGDVSAIQDELAAFRAQLLGVTFLANGDDGEATYERDAED